MALVRRGYGCTDVGRRRAVNEDAFLVDDELGLYVVADGMGGHSSGEIASNEAIETLHNMVRREKAALTAVESLSNDPPLPGGSRRPVTMRRALRILESAVQHATYMVFGMAENHPERRGMGTTLTVLFLRGDFALTAQVGDSRVYRVRDGAAEQITEDHTLIAWQLKRGLITPEQAQKSQQKNIITRAVGSRDYVQVDTNCVPVEPGDAYLLCSDGLHGYLEANEIADVMKLGPEIATKCLIDLANTRGGTDNITSVAVQLSIE
ncbi:MAG TPA: PP2C family serine/threonine-protein phosphatase [Polyangiales bacterium]|nr:PP2C family serine/threonine-protein phosphatase [Polyangiales bacterium]